MTLEPTSLLISVFDTSCVHVGAVSQGPIAARAQLPTVPEVVKQKQGEPATDNCDGQEPPLTTWKTSALPEQTAMSTAMGLSINAPGLLVTLGVIVALVVSDFVADADAEEVAEKETDGETVGVQTRALAKAPGPAGIFVRRRIR